MTALCASANTCERPTYGGLHQHHAAQATDVTGCSEWQAWNAANMYA